MSWPEGLCHRQHARSVRRHGGIDWRMCSSRFHRSNKVVFLCCSPLPSRFVSALVAHRPGPSLSRLVARVFFRVACAVRRGSVSRGIVSQARHRRQAWSASQVGRRTTTGGKNFPFPRLVDCPFRTGEPARHVLERENHSPIWTRGAARGGTAELGDEERTGSRRDQKCSSAGRVSRIFRRWSLARTLWPSSKVRGGGWWMVDEGGG